MSIFLRSFSEGLKIIFFPRTTVPTIMLLFLIAMIMVNRLGFHSIVRSNLFFMPIILFSILFIFIANLDSFTFERMMPLFGNGFFSTFFSGLSNLFAFGGISFLYLLPPYLKEQKKYKKIAAVSIGLSAFFLLTSVATLLFIFPFVTTTEEIFPLYLASRYIEFGRFFQRLDAVFLFVWIISVISYLSITLYFSTSIFKKITNLQHTKWISPLFSILVFAIGLLPENLKQISFLENAVYQSFVIILVFLVSIILLILANMKYQLIQKKKGSVSIDKASI